MSTWALGLALCALCTCGKDDKGAKGETKGQAATATATDPELPELPARPLGFESPRAIAYVLGKGRKDVDRADKEAKKPTPDWKSVADACRDALEKDANHLGAHHLLGVALAQMGENDEAVDHLSTALAGDWLRYGPGFAEHEPLSDLFATAKGKALLALNEAYRTSFLDQAHRGIFVVAKRAPFKFPRKNGKQHAPSRAELFAYSLDSKRYLRLTHTGESFIGYVMSPSKDRIAYLTATHYNIATGGITFHKASVGVLDAESFAPLGKPAKLKGEARELMVFFGAGEELQLQTDEPAALYSVDHEAGKLKSSTGNQFADFETLYEMGEFGREQPLLYATFDMARVLEPVGAVSKPPSDLVVTRFTVDTTRKEIVLPADGGKKIRRITVSPDAAHVSLVGIGDPCRAQYESALYVADARTGKLKHVHRGDGLHTVQWLDNGKLVFEADKGELRIYDVASGRTEAKITNKPGIALHTASNMIPFEHCPRPTGPAIPDEALGEGDEFEQGFEDGESEGPTIEEGE